MCKLLQKLETVKEQKVMSLLLHSPSCLTCAHSPGSYSTLCQGAQKVRGIGTERGEAGGTSPSESPTEAIWTEPWDGRLPRFFLFQGCRLCPSHRLWDGKALVDHPASVLLL